MEFAPFNTSERPLNNWQMTWSDGQRGSWFSIEHIDGDHIPDEHWLPASVPGEVHLDLWRSGLLEDPYKGLNAQRARWVEECIWIFRTRFDATPEEAKSGGWVRFDQLDYAAGIYLNGHLLGKHANAYTPCTLDAGDRLVTGTNELIVVLEGGLFSVADKPIEPFYTNSTDALLHKRIWLRKPQCSFGWDWSTRLVNVGMGKPVWFGRHEVLRVEQANVLARLDSNRETGTLKVQFFVENRTPHSVTATLLTTIKENGETSSHDVEVAPGNQCITNELTVPKPALWWPAGYGDQNRYTVDASLRVDGREIASRTLRTGFREIVVDQSPHPKEGHYFRLLVNGEPVFARGANFVPLDMIFMRADRTRYRTSLQLAREANCNFMRVWGGGLYEEDAFYETCDELGIMVWQDFIFACGGYPGNDPEFLASVTREAEFQVRRLATYPSLVMYCGNNENEWHTYDKPFGTMFPDHGLYHHVLPRIVSREDPGKFYQPSSPYSPDGAFPNLDTSGDQHPWEGGEAENDLYKYRTMQCRFPNEGGIIGSPSLQALRDSIEDPTEKEFSPNSLAWQLHDNGGPRFWSSFKLPIFFRDWLGLDPARLSLEDMAYWNGVLQGEGLKEFGENFRSRKWDSAAAIFWMFNDCWPTTRSWTIVDYHLNRTPAFPFVKRAFAPVMVALREENDQVHCYGVNDTLEPFDAVLDFGVFSFDGRYPEKQTLEVSLPANAAVSLANFPRAKWTDLGITQSAVFATLTRDGVTVARTRRFAPRFCKLELPEAEVQMERVGDSLEFVCECFAWNVCLDLEGQAPLDDNFFDLFPGHPHRVAWDRNKPLPLIRIGNTLTAHQIP